MQRYKYNDETREANIIPVCQENAAVSIKATSQATEKTRRSLLMKPMHYLRRSITHAEHLQNKQI